MNLEGWYIAIGTGRLDYCRVLNQYQNEDVLNMQTVQSLSVVVAQYPIPRIISVRAP